MDHFAIGDTVRIQAMPFRGVIGTVINIDTDAGKYLVRINPLTQGWYSPGKLQAADDTNNT